MTKKILTYSSPLLRKKSTEVKKIDGRIISITKDMIESLEASEIEGLALAAPQIGENLRIIIVEVREIKDKEGKVLQKRMPLTIYINPEIIKFSKEKAIGEEGCLSCPGLYGPVERPSKIRFTALNKDGKKLRVNASGLFAKIIQHEVDHLDGILFIDRIKDESKLKKVDLKDVKRTKK